MLPLKDSKTLGTEYVFQKLGKSLVPIENLKKGDALSLENLSGKIFKETYIPVRETCENIATNPSWLDKWRYN